jgi:hypothetical protein
MSAYVARLVARAHGRLPAVRPRLPSRFEPAPGPALSADAISIVDEAEVPAAPPPRNAAGPAAAPGSAPPPAAADAPPRTLAVLRAAAREAPVAPRSAPIAPPPASPRPVVPAPPGAPPIVEPAPPPATPLDPERTGPAVVPPPAPVPGRPRQTVPPPPAAAEAGDPVVQVTIGRVDVRAILPEPAKRVPRPQPPRRSLEDYLARTRR